jgi:hypothetical protein
VGGLNAILRLLSERGINVEYMYSFVEKSGEHAIMIFRFDRTEEAIDVLLAQLPHLFDGFWPFWGKSFPKR